MWKIINIGNKVITILYMSKPIPHTNKIANKHDNISSFYFGKVLKEVSSSFSLLSYSKFHFVFPLWFP